MVNRWHPLNGRRFPRHYGERRTTRDFVHVGAAPGVVTMVAAWMLDPVLCVGMEIGAPRVAPPALIDLHDLLIALGFRRKSPDDSNVVQEDRDEVYKTGESFARTPAHDGAGLGQASRDEDRRPRSGDQAVGTAADRGRRYRRDGGERR